MPGVSGTGYNNGITSLSSSYYNLAILEEVWAAQLYSWTADQSPVQFLEERLLLAPRRRDLPGNPHPQRHLGDHRVPVSTSNAFSFGTEVSSMGNGGIFNTISYGGIAGYS